MGTTRGWMTFFVYHYITEQLRAISGALCIIDNHLVCYDVSANSEFFLEFYRNEHKWILTMLLWNENWRLIPLKCKTENILANLFFAITLKWNTRYWIRNSFPPYFVLDSKKILDLGKCPQERCTVRYDLEVKKFIQN